MHVRGHMDACFCKTAGQKVGERKRGRTEPCATIWCLGFTGPAGMESQEVGPGKSHCEVWSSVFDSSPPLPSSQKRHDFSPHLHFLCSESCGMDISLYVLCSCSTRPALPPSSPHQTGLPSCYPLPPTSVSFYPHPSCSCGFQSILFICASQSMG